MSRKIPLLEMQNIILDTVGTVFYLYSMYSNPWRKWRRKEKRRIFSPSRLYSIIYRQAGVGPYRTQSPKFCFVPYHLFGTVRPLPPGPTILTKLWHRVCLQIRLILESMPNLKTRKDALLQLLLFPVIVLLANPVVFFNLIKS